MICDSCHGTGWVLFDEQGRVVSRLLKLPVKLQAIPCPECGGSGRSHCCEGERPGNNGDCG